MSNSFDDAKTDTNRDDRPHEACGVFGIYAPGEDVGRLTYFGLFALQHRGQESAGIAVSVGNDLAVYRDMGLVNQVFNEKILSVLKGDMAIGHTRYSTTGSSMFCNAQPILIKTQHRIMALGHNGNLINSSDLQRAMLKKNIKFEGTSDSEVLAWCIASSEKKDIIEAIAETMPQLKGAYSLVLLTPESLIAVRDPLGIRPLCIGKLNHYPGKTGYVFASETCALNVIGAEYIREVDPGEIVVVRDGQLKSFHAVPGEQQATCVFELIYFARPDSYILGKSVHFARRRMGKILAREHPVDADLVVNVPDSSTPAAIGYSEAAGIPFGEVLIKNRYIHRTFIQPDQRLRDLGVRMKLNPLKEEIEGKRIVLVDDSIVRGTTSAKIVKLLKEAGAKEVHVRVSSPPIRHPCYYGIDMATRSELIASGREIDEVREKIGADSLAYLSMDGLMEAVGVPRERFCAACFTDEYPIKVPEQLELDKLALEKTEPTFMKR